MISFSLWFYRMRLVAFILILAGTISLAEARSYYEGKTIRMIIPLSPGGGTDTFGRLISRHLAEHIPGRPTIITENVPGAASLMGSNEFAERVAHDGLTLLTASGQLNLRAFLGLRNLRLKLDALEPIVAAPMGHVTAISAQAGIKDPTKLNEARRPLTKGITDPIGSLESVMALELLGVEYRPVPGYAGRSETRLGLERGELMLNTQSTPAYLARVLPLVKEGRVIPLYAMGFFDAQGNPVRDPGLPDMITVPELYEQIHGRKPSGMVWEAFKAVVPLVQNTRGTIWAHNDIPAAALQDLRTGVERMARDPAFLQAGANIMEGYPIIHGDDLRQIKAGMQATPPEVIAYLREFLTTRFGLAFQ
jgi:hypothetical protein